MAYIPTHSIRDEVFDSFPSQEIGKPSTKYTQDEHAYRVTTSRTDIRDKQVDSFPPIFNGFQTIFSSLTGSEVAPFLSSGFIFWAVNFFHELDGETNTVTRLSTTKMYVTRDMALPLQISSLRRCEKRSKSCVEQYPEAGPS